MNYQELQNILRQNQVNGVMQSPKALSLQDVISGIQSQYTPNIQQFEAPQGMRPPSNDYSNFFRDQQTSLAPQSLMQTLQAAQPSQPMMTGAKRFASPLQAFEQQAFAPVRQQAQTFTPGAFNIADYAAKPTVADVISTINSDTGGNDGGNNSAGGTGIDGTGLTQSSNVSPGMVGGLATLGGLVTGTPLGLAANVVGKGGIADAINAQAYASNVANNMAVIGAELGLDPNDPANQGAIAAGIDTALSGAKGQPTATPGPSGTGAQAAAAGQAAANAAATAGYSPEAIGLAQQTAVNGVLGGMTEAQAVNAATMGPPTAENAQSIADSFGAGIGSVGPSSDSNAVGTADAASESLGGDGIGGAGTGVGDGGGSAGGKIICTKLHELGLMPKNIYEADQAFGLKLVNESPETYYGYVRWAKHIVNLMSRDDLLGKTAVFCAYHIATPWSLAMAEEMGQPVKASWFGKFLMKRGLQFCKLVGKSNKEMVTA